jgi:large subunit ribosomal protein L29
MKAEEIRALAADELAARIAQLEEERFRLRFRGATEALEDPLRLRTIRRDIARLKTVARERALGLARGRAGQEAPAGGAARRGRTAGGAKAPRARGR